MVSFSLNKLSFAWKINGVGDFLRRESSFEDELLSKSWGNNLENGAPLQEARGMHGVGLWKAIRENWEAFKTRTRFLVDNGRRINF